MNVCTHRHVCVITARFERAKEGDVKKGNAKHTFYAHLGLLVRGPQLRFLSSGPPQGTMEGEMTFVIKEYFSLPLTFNCPQSPFLGLECYSKHQLFVVLNACLFPALPSYCNFLLPRQSTGSVKWMEMKSWFGDRDERGNRERCSL